MGIASESLRNEEQILRYRQLAAEALAMAGRTTDKRVQATYLVMASDWHLLAAEMQYDLEAAELEDMPPAMPLIDGLADLDSQTGLHRPRR
jgi:hypothetical protein